MGKLLRVFLVLSCLSLAVSTDPPCVIELECRECVPDNMPLVTTHGATNGSVAVPAGDEIEFACYGGKFLLYPLHETLMAVCEAGRFRLRQDGTLRHLLHLGCQENIFEDGLHSVEHCGSPLQGRAYLMQEKRTTRHLATVCFDADRALAVFTHITNAARNRLTMPLHDEQKAPLSLLGNFNHMFDAKTRSEAEKLYSDDVRMNRRLRELLKHERYTFADQTLTSAKLLGSDYFWDQNVRVSDFVSNRVAVWSSVVNGNLRHLQRDVAKFMRLSRAHRPMDIYVGTHGTLSLRSGHSRTDLYLKPGRFPVPKYIWTVVHDTQNEKALAIVLLNDPFVAVSEIKEAVFCESACGRVSWLPELRRNRNYETPVYGLVFCCAVRDFANVVTEMPADIVRNVTVGNNGMLMDIL